MPHAKTPKMPLPPYFYDLYELAKGQYTGDIKDAGTVRAVSGAGIFLSMLCGYLDKRGSENNPQEKEALGNACTQLLAVSRLNPSHLDRPARNLEYMAFFEAYCDLMDRHCILAPELEGKYLPGA
ncbi:hypothetical protein LJC46_02155 [Desulfovibrio sp. OttesenSCG-928-G15]|nr:hypothetical protein [Desulfovibrio sp. OttesenSCG-928-G15]